MDAEDLLLREFLGIRTAVPSRGPVDPVEQRADGTWATFNGGPADLSTTVEAYAALRLAGDAPDAPHLSARRGVDPGLRRHRGDPGLHQDLAGAVGLVVLG